MASLLLCCGRRPASPPVVCDRGDHQSMDHDPRDRRACPDGHGATIELLPAIVASSCLVVHPGVVHRSAVLGPRAVDPDDLPASVPDPRGRRFHGGNRGYKCSDVQRRPATAAITTTITASTTTMIMITIMKLKRQRIRNKHPRKRLIRLKQ